MTVAAVGDLYCGEHFHARSTGGNICHAKEAGACRDRHKTVIMHFLQPLPLQLDCMPGALSEFC